MKLKTYAIFAVTILVAVVLAACSGESTNGESASKVNDTQDIKKLVSEYSLGNIENQSASITSQQLIVTESKKSKQVYDLPENDFFVSIAPYINKTHPCTIHSLTGCQGEMVEEDFDVYIEDTEGNLILDETLKSESNGFIDLWLLRDKTYHITITHDGKTVESEFSTFESDNTCITTMQLT
ncbi:MAG TPA: CueP family metal-binding protein [Bacillus sp. (in: firmicutes)]